MKHTFRLVLGLATLMGVHGMSYAQEQSMDDDMTMMSWRMPLMNDGQFMDKVIAGENLEIKLGKLAEEKGSDSFTKSFGKMIGLDHAHALDELARIRHMRRSYGYDSMWNDLRQGLTEDDQATYDRLAAMSGTSFDEAFRRQVMDDHRMHLMMFKMEAANGTDFNLRMFAQDCIPVIRRHLTAMKDRSMPMADSQRAGG